MPTLPTSTRVRVEAEEAEDSSAIPIDSQYEECVVERNVNWRVASASVVNELCYQKQSRWDSYFEQCSQYWVSQVG